MKRRILGIIVLTAVSCFGLGYIEGTRAGGKYWKTITDCGNDRECITAAGGDPSIILD